MNTARVVVIDEDQNEALVLLEALGKAGIGSVYVKGDEKGSLPDSPHVGIRLVFLDLKLLPTDEAKDYIPYTVEVLSKSVQVDPHVTGIICWTKHSEEIDFLKEELDRQGLQPAFVAPFENKLAISHSGDLDLLLGEISRITSAMPGRQCVESWEQDIHGATTSATTTLLQLSGSDEELLRILAAVAVGSADERISDPQSAMNALYIGLGAVQQDATESLGATATTPADHTESLHEAVGEIRRNRLSLHQRSRLNEVLLGSIPSSLRPGCLFVVSERKLCPIGQEARDIRRFLYDVYSDHRDNKPFIRQVQQASKPCMVELTPACDFAQNKCPVSRLVGGILIKLEDEEMETQLQLPAESRAFSKEVQPIWIQNPHLSLEGAYKIVLNARQLCAVPFEDLKLEEAVVCLRHHITSDIRSWFAAHASRVGYVAVN
ncbi:MAG: hypothetical protein DWQ31_18335 [Planctomycetota bacterium]|nr:MAG: hypothetical protein DWQ31_18335 [Planctomycetota bacterium]REJ87323.1 MAG: hypothetical protein DWQ35_21675 [Planctomycetota bacterium]REK22664.1 MAG: hypothetical protein DWQ42_16570 [Planctomycetota bacterium]REK42503.1 MAG: hypothetical protein DWQ46_13020 [Planctomycetota bacterium]